MKMHNEKCKIFTTPVGAIIDRPLVTIRTAPISMSSRASEREPRDLRTKGKVEGEK